MTIRFTWRDQVRSYDIMDPISATAAVKAAKKLLKAELMAIGHVSTVGQWKWNIQ